MNAKQALEMWREKSRAFADELGITVTFYAGNDEEVYIEATTEDGGFANIGSTGTHQLEL